MTGPSDEALRADVEAENSYLRRDLIARLSNRITALSTDARVKESASSVIFGQGHVIELALVTL